MSPRSRATNERMRAESRARIIEHGLQLFSERGYDATTVKMIAEAAGISQGLIYAHFPSKEALLVEIFEQSMRDVQESFALAEAEGPPEGRVERLLRGSFAVLRRNERFWRLSYGVRMQPAVLAHLGDRIHDWTDAVRQTLRRYLAESGARDPDVDAEILFALIDGVSQHYVLEPDRYPLEAVVERIVERYGRMG